VIPKEREEKKKKRKLNEEEDVNNNSGKHESKTNATHQDVQDEQILTVLHNRLLIKPGGKWYDQVSISVTILYLHVTYIIAAMLVNIYEIFVLASYACSTNMAIMSLSFDSFGND
jgi:hypothetical protein